MVLNNEFYYNSWQTVSTGFISESGFKLNLGLRSSLNCNFNFLVGLGFRSSVTLKNYNTTSPCFLGSPFNPEDGGSMFF
jgi:hypothetical protein